MSLPATFQNKVIAITGASRGIGLAVAKYLLARGATVSMCATSSENLAKALEEIHKEFPDAKDRVMTCVVDISKLDSVKSWIDQTVAKFGPLDGCCNNAAKEQRKIYPMTELDADYFHDIININVCGLFHCLKEEMKAIKDGGSIVNLGSVASHYASAGTAAYITAKHAVLGLTKTAAFEGAPRGIRVNAMCPGTVNTTMMTQPFETAQGDFYLTPDKVPALMQRLAEPGEVAAFIAFLLGDDSKFITKATYYMDGGFLEGNYTS
ncbi:2-5-dichloro-2-5-cyclohexadiene-1-4-diol dehydrogenase [Apiospora hydei]|uniref:2-5-dichloro-2-5-cyclohexadiene-1-4-diol dehydrogenase n=1 Tax=Apiospora hydei TaxID=1337664 RepID=A0ABR1UVS7_9PEZI